MTGIGQPKRTIWEEIQIQLSGLAWAPLLQVAFDRYHLEWMNRPWGSYCLALVCEFYASYAATVAVTTLKGSKNVE